MADPIYLFDFEPVAAYSPGEAVWSLYNGTTDKTLVLRDLALPTDRCEAQTSLTTLVRTTAWDGETPGDIRKMDSGSTDCASGIRVGTRGTLTASDVFRQFNMHGHQSFRTANRCRATRSVGQRRPALNFAENWSNALRVAGDTQSLVIRPGEGIALQNTADWVQGTPYRIYAQFRVDVAGTPTFYSRAELSLGVAGDVWWGLWNGSASNVVYLDALDCHEITDTLQEPPFVTLIRTSGMRDDGGVEMTYDCVAPVKLDSSAPDFPAGVRSCTHAWYNGWTRRTYGDANVVGVGALNVTGWDWAIGGSAPWWLGRWWSADTPLRGHVLPPDRLVSGGGSYLFRPNASLKLHRSQMAPISLNPGEGIALICMVSSLSPFTAPVISGFSLQNLRVHAKVSVETYAGPNLSPGPTLNHTPYLTSGGVRIIG